MELLEFMKPSVLLLPPSDLKVVGMITENVFHQMKDLKAAGYGKKAIARIFDLDPGTVRSYLKKDKWTPYQREAVASQSLSGIEEWLKNRAPEVGFNGRVLFQEAQLKGFAGSYETIKRFLRPMRDDLRSSLLATVRFETGPGQQGQVDWGSANVWVGEQQVRIHFFALVLGYSRRLFAKAYLNEKKANVIDGHLAAFAWFGGYPRELLFDYVTGNIIEIMCPVSLCGGSAEMPQGSCHQRFD